MSHDSAASRQGQPAPSLSKSDLSLPRQRLIDLMQDLTFGRIEQLVIRGGEPVLDPSPTVIREQRFGSRAKCRFVPLTNDWVLKEQVVDFCRTLDQCPDMVLDVLEVKDGLPFRMIVRETAR